MMLKTCCGTGIEVSLTNDFARCGVNVQLFLLGEPGLGMIGLEFEEA